MANRALLLAMVTPDPPKEYEPGDAVLGANVSIPLFWLSLFDTSSPVLWPCTLADNDGYTALVSPQRDCVARSRDRLSRWKSRWPHQIGDLSATWLDFVEQLGCAFLGVWTEEISDMTGDIVWQHMLRSYLAGLDDPSKKGSRRHWRKVSFTSILQVRVDLVQQPTILLAFFWLAMDGQRGLHGNNCVLKGVWIARTPDIPGSRLGKVLEWYLFFSECDLERDNLVSGLRLIRSINVGHTSYAIYAAKKESTVCHAIFCGN
jgi:hypothetical protein